MRKVVGRILIGLAILGSSSIAKATEFTDVWSLGRAGLKADEKSDFVNARRDFDSAVQLHPKNPFAYAHRALFFAEHHQFALAAKDFDFALKLRPTAWSYAYWRASCYSSMGRYDLALADYNQLMTLHTMTDRSSLLNNRAWIFATCPDARYRNGRQAVEDATKAVNVAGKAGYLDTLAAAYAETGDFESAVKYEEKAIHAQSKIDKVQGGEERLGMYKQHQPYRDHRDKEKPEESKK